MNRRDPPAPSDDRPPATTDTSASATTGANGASGANEAPPAPAPPASSSSSSSPPAPRRHHVVLESVDDAATSDTIGNVSGDTTIDSASLASTAAETATLAFSADDPPASAASDAASADTTTDATTAPDVDRSTLAADGALTTDGASSFFDHLMAMARSYNPINDILGTGAGVGAGPGAGSADTPRPALPAPAPDDDQAIVITVNYVFSDQNNPDTPNRLGLLVMLLPNNLLNREPLAIQEFVRLATQMAYLSIFDGSGNHLFPGRGITFDKFTLFPFVTHLDDDNRKCYICFEDMELGAREPEPADDAAAAGTASEGDRTVKKRRLYDNTSETTSRDSLLSTAPAATESAALRALTTLGDGANTTDGANSSGSATGDSGRPPKYLCDHREEFAHVAIELPCHHVFGRSCLLEWLKDHATCPLCREKLEEPRLLPFTSGSLGFTLFQFPQFPARNTPNLTSANAQNDTTSAAPGAGAAASEFGLDFLTALSGGRLGDAAPLPRGRDGATTSTRRGRGLLGRMLRLGELDVPESSPPPPPPPRSADAGSSSSSSSSTRPAPTRAPSIILVLPFGHPPLVLFPQGVSLRRTPQGVETTEDNGQLPPPLPPRQWRRRRDSESRDGDDS